MCAIEMSQFVGPSSFHHGDHCLIIFVELEAYVFLQKRRPQRDRRNANGTDGEISCSYLSLWGTMRHIGLSLRRTRIA